jgi:hypothetical protein
MQCVRISRLDFVCTQCERTNLLFMSAVCSSPSVSVVSQLYWASLLCRVQRSRSARSPRHEPKSQFSDFTSSASSSTLKSHPFLVPHIACCMCGILLSVRAISACSSSELQEDSLFDALLESVKPRGPDSLITHSQLVEIRPDLFIEVKLAASVLGLRGDGVTTQPLVGKRGVLAWNGQVSEASYISCL